MSERHRGAGPDEWRIPRGVTVAGALVGLSGFLAFEWFFIPPRGTLSIANPVDWFVMVPFLVAGVLLAQYVRGARDRRAREDADRVKDALLAAVSHDLRTPLTTIKALAHDMSALGDERSQVIEEQADRLNRYVAQILDLTRINAGAMPVRIEVNAVDDLLSALVDEAGGQLGGRQLVVRVDGDEPLLFGRFDLLMCVRILANLVDNAQKHSPPAAPIEVAASRTGHTLRLAVADRGSGVPDAERGELFTAFHQRVPAAAGAGSAGVGLALSRRMAELQGGTLTYEPREGGGSVFVLAVAATGLSDLSRAEEAAREFGES